MRLPKPALTFRPWRGPSSGCERLTPVGMVPAAALAASSYLMARVARTKPAFVTPPRDSMGP